MVQRFPELDRIYQGMAVNVRLVMGMQILAAEMEHGNLSAVCPDSDTLKVTAHAQEKRTPEYVCGF